MHVGEQTRSAGGIASLSVRGMEVHRLRLAAGAGLAVVAAGAATSLLRPRSGLIEPAAVDARAYFSAGATRAAQDFRDPQR